MAFFFFFFGLYFLILSRLFLFANEIEINLIIYVLYFIYLIYFYYYYIVIFISIILLLLKLLLLLQEFFFIIYSFICFSFYSFYFILFIFFWQSAMSTVFLQLFYIYPHRHTLYIYNRMLMRIYIPLGAARPVIRFYSRLATIHLHLRVTRHLNGSLSGGIFPPWTWPVNHPQSPTRLFTDFISFYFLLFFYIPFFTLMSLQHFFFLLFFPTFYLFIFFFFSQYGFFPSMRRLFISYIHIYCRKYNICRE